MNILFETKFGSHLYGTDTPSSDLDYKGVYLASMKDILFKKDKETIEVSSNNSDSRNTKDDIDKTYVELRRFIKDALSGQTYALDMLFAPENMWISSSDIWKEIIENRHKFLSKNVQPFIGYCRQQAGKYGLKGSRLDALLQATEYLTKNTYKEGTKEKLRFEDVRENFPFSEFAKLCKTTSKAKGGVVVEEELLDVIGKKFSQKMFVVDILKPLQKLNEQYGERAREAMKNEGVDWKAISHAYRCCYQLEELATFGTITFPLARREKLVSLKKGEILYTKVQEQLPALMDKAIKAVNQGVLPETPDKDFWDNFICKVYL